MKCNCSKDNICNDCLNRLEKKRSNQLAVSICEYLDWRHSQMVRREENRQKAMSNRRYKANGVQT